MVIKKDRLPILFLAIVCLGCGIWSGLNRIGWGLPFSPMAAHHGAIMIGGFLGTLISLEKVIPLKNKWLYLIPALNGLSVVFFLIGQPVVSIYILVCSSTSLSIIFLYYLAKQRTIIYALMLAGSLAWLTGNILLLTKFLYPLAFPWWAAFALLIIVAERLDLMKFLPVSRGDKAICISLLFIFLVGATLSFHGIGNLICGFVLSAVAIWLMKHDVIGINLTKQRQPRFVAVALLAGYIAMLLSGVLLLVQSDKYLSYDAIVHSFFIGFVFSMIFAHGPIILPGVLGIKASPYHYILYYWLGVLQISWLVRVFADVAIDPELRKITGLLTTIAILGYFATLAALMISNRRNVTVR